MSLELHAPGLSEDTAAEAIRMVTVAAPEFFVARYFRDQKNEALRLKEFQLEFIEAFKDPTCQRLLVMLPPAHGKTTLKRALAAHSLVENPNLRIMSIMANATDAEQDLAALERKLADPREMLVKEHGPFKSDLDWKAASFTVQKRVPTDDKEPSFAAYGVGSNVFGHRTDLALCDDIVTLANSGPGVSEGQRQSVHDWFVQGVLPCAGKEGKVVVIGTPMDHRDLYHELMKPEYHFKVIRMPAIIDDDLGTVLWEEQFPYSWLIQQREQDYTSFMKRYQMIALDETQARFREQSLALCRDNTRRWGEVTQDMKERGFTQVLVNFDWSSAQPGTKSRRSKYCGVCVLAHNPIQAEPKDYYVLEIFHLRDLPEKLVALIHALYDRYGAKAAVIEANGVNQALHQVKELRDWKAAGARIIEFWTTGEKKLDPVMGVDTLVGPVEATKLHFPYGDERSRKEVDDFFTNELLSYPQALLSDRLMALWFGVHTARQFGIRSLKSKLRKTGMGGFFRGLVPPTYGKAQA